MTVMGIIDELFSSALPAKSINDGVYQAQSHPCPQLYVLSVLTSSKIQIVTINNGIALHRVCCSLFLWHRMCPSVSSAIAEKTFWVLLPLTGLQVCQA